MNWKRILAMLLLSIFTVSFFLACTLTSVPFVSQTKPTSTKRATRTPRATFTPRPAETQAPEVEPTEEILPTDEPTPEPPPPTIPPRPTRRVTQPPPPPTEPPPAEPTAIPPTEAPKYPYEASVVTCTHAGNAYIKGSVCSDRNCGSKLAGVTVVMSDAPYGAIGDNKVQTDVNGEYTFTLSGDGPRPGTWYVWIVNNRDEPMSTVGGPIQLDMGHNSDDLINKCPNTSAFVTFFKP